MISIVSPMRAEILPAVPGLRPAGVHRPALGDDRRAQVLFLDPPLRSLSFASPRRAGAQPPSPTVAILTPPRPQEAPLAPGGRPRKHLAAQDSSTPTPKGAHCDDPPISSMFFERVPRRDKMAIETPDGRTISYGELFARSGRMARALVGLRRRARRPGRGADRQVARGDRAGARLLSRRRGVAAAQHRLHARRARVFPCRRRAGADALPPHLVARLERSRRQAGLPAVESFGDEGEGGFFDRLAAAREELPAVFRAKDDLAAILYTSAPPAAPRARC